MPLHRTTVAAFAAQALVTDLARRARLRAHVHSSKTMAVPAPMGQHTLSNADLMAYLNEIGVAASDSSMWSAPADERFVQAAVEHAPDSDSEEEAGDADVLLGSAGSGQAVGAASGARGGALADLLPAAGSKPVLPTAPAATSSVALAPVSIPGEMPGGVKFKSTPLGQL